MDVLDYIPVVGSIKNTAESMMALQDGDYGLAFYKGTEALIGGALDVASFGAGSSIAKAVIKGTAKELAKDVIKKTVAREAAGFAAAYGTRIVRKVTKRHPSPRPLRRGKKPSEIKSASKSSNGHSASDNGNKQASVVGGASGNGRYEESDTDSMDSYNGRYEESDTDSFDGYNGRYEESDTDRFDSYNGRYEESDTDSMDSYNGRYEKSDTDSFDSYNGRYEDSDTDSFDSYNGRYRYNDAGSYYGDGNVTYPYNDAGSYYGGGNVTYPYNDAGSYYGGGNVTYPYNDAGSYHGGGNVTYPYNDAGSYHEGGNVTYPYNDAMPFVTSRGQNQHQGRNYGNSANAGSNTYGKRTIPGRYSQDSNTAQSEAQQNRDDDDRKRDDDKERKRGPKRGHHIINNDIIKLYKKIIENFITKISGLHYSMLKKNGSISADRQIFDDYNCPLPRDIMDEIETELVVSTGFDFDDQNAEVYGHFRQRLEEAILEYMETIHEVYKGRWDIRTIMERKHTAKKALEALIEEMIERDVFVDKPVYDFWIWTDVGCFPNPQKESEIRRLKFEKLRKAVVKMLRALIEKAEAWVKAIVEAIERYYNNQKRH